MSLKQTKKTENILSALAGLSVIAALLTRIWLLLIATVVLLAAFTVVHVKFWRCPHCGGPLLHAPGETCPLCGGTIDVNQ